MRSRSPRPRVSHHARCHWRVRKTTSVAPEPSSLSHCSAGKVGASNPSRTRVSTRVIPHPAFESSSRIEPPFSDIRRVGRVVELELLFPEAEVEGPGALLERRQEEVTEQEVPGR